MRFLVPFSVCRLRCAVARGGQPRTVPLRRSIVRSFAARHVTHRPSPEVSGSADRARGAADRSRPCGFESAFRALRVAPCAARAAGGPSRFTPVRPGHASRSLFGATFRYPCFVEPFHNRAAHPHFVSRARVVRQRSWDFRTLRSVPRLQVPAFVIRGAIFLCARADLRRSSPPAVIEFTSRR